MTQERKRRRRATSKARKDEAAQAGLDSALRERGEQARGILTSVRSNLPDRWELLVWGIILAVALVLRLWDLGDRALHHDESLHATYSWYLFDRVDYKHDPMMHGPFQFHAGALAFVLFGDSDFVARVPAALLGTGMVALVWLLRGYLGRLGALTAATLIALSPTLLYFSRFAREDIYTAFWTLGIVVFLWRYLAERRELWLYLGAAALAFSFATKETTYMTAAIFLAFLEVLVALDLLGQLRRQREMHRVEVGVMFAWLLAFSWLVVIVWPLVPSLRRRWGLHELPATGVALLVMGTLAAPQYAGGMQLLHERQLPAAVVVGGLLGFGAGGFFFADARSRLKPLAESAVPGVVVLVVAALVAGAAAGWFTSILPGNSGYRSVDEETLRNSSVIVLLLLSLYAGLLWNPRIWLISAVAFYGVYIFLFTTFFTNPAGFWSGIWGSTDYWIEQQSVRRGDQPAFYYFMILPVYEFLPLLLAALGILYQAIRRQWASLALLTLAGALLVAGLYSISFPVLRDHWSPPEPLAVLLMTVAAGLALFLCIAGGRGLFDRFLVFWTVAALLAFTIAAEKMPWLTVHIALPIALLAGRTVNELFGRVSLPRDVRLPEALRMAVQSMNSRVVLAVGPVAAMAAVIILIVLAASVMAVVLAILLALVAAAAVALAGRAGGQVLVQAATATIAAGLLVFSIRTAAVASFEHGDTPVELLVYTQTAPDIPRLRDAIEELADATGLGRDVPIVVDHDDLTWPWVWYLRDYNDVSYQRVTDEPLPEGAILLINKSNVANLQYDAEQYDSGEAFHFRWWFPEDYKVLTLSNFHEILFDPGNWKTWRDFYVERESVVDPGLLGSVDGVAYFPKTLIAAAGGPAYTQPPEEPVAGPDGQVIIGKPGGGRGQFSSPASLAVDGEGNLYVADSGNHRIQKFDGDGHFLDLLGTPGGGEGQFNEPWGVAVDAQGNLYVADTWNHRIQKFDSSLEFQMAWGRPFTAVGERAPEPLELFGPRSIAIDPEGNLMVVDTGNKRVVKFSPDGVPLAQYGGPGAGPGQFEEPVGIAVSTLGEVLVADTWNRRIQRFDSNFQYLGEIPVDGWGSTEVGDKPYLAVLSDGTILASDPANSALVVFNAEGVQLATWSFPSSALGGSRPLGVAQSAAGDVFGSDAAGGQVRRIPLSNLTGP